MITLIPVGKSIKGQSKKYIYTLIFNVLIDRTAECGFDFKTIDVYRRFPILDQYKNGFASDATDTIVTG